jgi:hypothetical protein
MRNTTCKICSKEFPPREGKLYCSNACKQKGFNNNKQELKAPLITIEKEEKKIKKEFYFSDYKEFIKLFPESIDSFNVFCFFRKNIKGDFNAIIFHDYINSFSSDFWENLYSENNNHIRKKYIEFETSFLGDDTILNL